LALREWQPYIVTSFTARAKKPLGPFYEPVASVTSRSPGLAGVQSVGGSIVQAARTASILSLSRTLAASLMRLITNRRVHAHRLRRPRHAAGPRLRRRRIWDCFIYLPSDERCASAPRQIEAAQSQAVGPPPACCPSISAVPLHAKSRSRRKMCADPLRLSLKPFGLRPPLRWRLFTELRKRHGKVCRPALTPLRKVFSA
jgi:hypothetical protein